MSVVLLDPRFPAMIPVDAIPLLQGNVSYTEEVPVRVRWTILDLGGHTVDDSDVLVTTDLTNPTVRKHLDTGADLVKAPSLLVEMEPQRQLEGSGSAASTDAADSSAASASAPFSSTDATSDSAQASKKGPQMPSASAIKGDFSKKSGANKPGQDGNAAAGVTGVGAKEGNKDAAQGGEYGAAQGDGQKAETKDVEYSGDGVVDGQIVGTDEHTAAVAGMRRTQRTEVPASVMDEIEDAVALMARAHRQGEWEQSMTHTSLIPFLREETEELARIVEAMERYGKGKHEGGKACAGGAGDAQVAGGAGAGANTASAGADKVDAKFQGRDVPEWMEQELCMELSDVLLQVLFHAEIANRRGAFDIGHVAGAFVAKLRSRAPYLFESVERSVPKTEQDRLWEEGKKRERAEREKALGKDGQAYADLVDAKDEASERANDHVDAGGGAGAAAAATGAGTAGAGAVTEVDASAAEKSAKPGAEKGAPKAASAQNASAQGSQKQASKSSVSRSQASGSSATPSQAPQGMFTGGMFTGVDYGSQKAAGQSAASENAAGKNVAGQKGNGNRVEPHASEFPAQHPNNAQSAQHSKGTEYPQSTQPAPGVSKGGVLAGGLAGGAAGSANVAGASSAAPAAAGQANAGRIDFGQAAAGSGAVESGAAESGLQAAENVIREAREMGLSDSEIPMDIRYPMVGLEMDKPGEADRRLKDAVQNFRDSLKSKHKALPSKSANSDTSK